MRGRVLLPLWAATRRREEEWESRRKKRAEGLIIVDEIGSTIRSSSAIVP